MLNVSALNFRKPLFIRDTVHMRLGITGARLTSDGTRGILGRRFELVKHGGEVAQDMLSDVLVRRRLPAGQVAGAGG